ncbi:MAG TPA: sugar phosphate nucleotidyltransferase [Chthoniobacterales bacterium]|jgi:NDP-sugar pyrophosphorylase family protein|nr:sugar phosphate nucleotidyltransferase [Chthoniobacterales bacterium]
MAQIKQAFVLGAGLGTRLRPLTEELPKPLVPIFQKPLITFALDHLIDLGIGKIFINTHRLPEKFADAFPEYRYAGKTIRFVNEPVLLETGGGIKNIEHELGRDPFITYSGDVLTEIDLGPLIAHHFAHDSDVTLALRHTGLGSGVALRDERVVDISNRYGIPGEFDFANIAVWNPSVFARIPPNEKISFIPVLGDWIGHGGKIGGVVLEEGKWFNLGSRAEYFEVHRAVLNGWRPGYVKDKDWTAPVHPSAIVDPSAHVRGCSVIGKDCGVGAGAVLEDTILWAGAQIASNSELIGCIVRARKSVTGTHRNIDI